MIQRRNRYPSAMTTPLTAKTLILDLLLAIEGEPLSAREAISGAALLGIRENNVRIALMRLSAEGLIEAVDRGVYRLSGAAHELAGEVATWRSIESRTRAWSGGWLVVHSGPLGRSDRSRTKARTRALDMLGFRALEPGLEVRPDNIETDIDAVRARLVKLGLEADAAVFVASQFDAARSARIATLWDGAALNAAYRTLRRDLLAWLQRAARLEPDVAAREALLMGRKAIRQVVFDPLLPAPMVDVDARHTFFDTVRAYDRAGQAIWRRVRGLPPLD
jgi:phenylacetic acid degradation operon negative regulatory protein